MSSNQSEDLETPGKPGSRNGNKLVLETTLVETIGTEKIDQWLEGDDNKRQEGILEGGTDGITLCLDNGRGSLTVCVCQNSWKCILKLVIFFFFTIYKLHLNFRIIRKKALKGSRFTWMNLKIIMRNPKSHILYGTTYIKYTQ